MPYDKNATANLGCLAENIADYQNAQPGQWFIGVLDTANKMIYLLPIDVQSAGAQSNTAERSMNRFASGVLANTPGSRKHTGGLRNVHQTTGWASADPNWMNTVDGNTTHEKIQAFYNLDQDDLLGFTLIKVTGDNAGFAMLKCSSNTMNMRCGADWDGKDCGMPAQLSFSRGTHKASGFAEDGSGVPEGWEANKSNYVPGQGSYPPGTTQMPENWSDALAQFLSGPDFSIGHVIKSNE